MLRAAIAPTARITTMGLLFLDPLVLVAIGTTLIGCWLVWRGVVRFWFGRSAAWTALVWPLPLVLVLTPLAVGPLRATLNLVSDASGLQFGDTADAVVFAALYLVPLIGLTVWPPRWLLPAWARARLVMPARTSPSVSDAFAPGDASVPADATVDDGRSGVTVVPACLGRRGHGSRARWIWRVDAVAGMLTVADGHIRFRPDPPAGTSLPTGDLAVPPATAPARNEPSERPGSDPGGGHSATPGEVSFGRRYLDADLAAVDEVRIHARRPWADDGALTLALADRASAHLWIADVDRLRRALASSR